VFEENLNLDEELDDMKNKWTASTKINVDKTFQESEETKTIDDIKKKILIWL